MKTEITNAAVSLLRDELEARGISQAAAAAAMSIPRSRLTDIIHGRKRISIDTALRLERFLGMRAALWLGLQQDYELGSARQEIIDTIKMEVTPAIAS
jgi:addiction module HigA family antidote